MDMTFIAAAHTDVGIRKQTNQDSALLLQAQTPEGEVLLAVICDGMGGLSKGELASAVVIRAFARWFHETLPALLREGLDEHAVNKGWQDIVYDSNARITRYSAQHGISMGTTLAALLLAGGRYYLMSVGDSRIYQITDAMHQLTVDQTFVQREVELGNMTPQQAASDPKRNVLLQCIGASQYIEPASSHGEIPPGCAFLLCSDGFRHVVSGEEFYEGMRPGALADEAQIQQVLEHFTNLNKYRREPDNISSILVRVKGQ